MLDEMLKQACEAATWDYGEAWLKAGDRPLLKISDAWFIHPGLTDPRQCAWEQFRVCSEKLLLHLGEGLPGRVGQSQQPEWIEDVSIQSESYFLRNQIAIAFGAKAAYGTPLTLGSESVVLAFFLSEARSPDAAKISATQTVIQTAIADLTALI